MKTVKQEILEALGNNVKEVRLIIEFVAIITGEAEDVVTHAMVDMLDKELILVSDGDNSYLYVAGNKDNNLEVLAEFAEAEAEFNAKVDESLKNIVW
jgi:hypothetical protein